MNFLFFILLLLLRNSIKLGFDGLEDIELGDDGLCGSFGCGLFRLLDLVLRAADELDYEEDAECNDEEVKYSRDEVAKCNCYFCCCNFSCLVENCFLKYPLPVLEIDTTGNKADERHDDVVDERGYDTAECGADDNADCHIDNVALGNHSLEFI